MRTPTQQQRRRRAAHPRRAQKRVAHRTAAAQPPLTLSPTPLLQRSPKAATEATQNVDAKYLWRRSEGGGGAEGRALAGEIVRRSILSTKH